ncbi:MAG: PP2C family protein-serine/threonine phosphatase [Planctomycetia bacterium]
MGSESSLDCCDLTDIGRRRSNNQDSKAVLRPWTREQRERHGWLLVVADGMGAHAAGEMASAIAAEQVPLIYEKLAARSPPLALRTSIEQANGEIYAKGSGSPELKGMGTTCTALALVSRGAIVGHVGDSRAYRIRADRIEQLTRDHSLVWELQEMQATGELAADVAVRDAPKNIITRSLGPHPQVNVDLEGPFAVEADDVFVLCSDGLSGVVGDREIGAVAATLSPREAAAALVGLALARGAPDNVTVIVAKAGVVEASRQGAANEPWPLTDDAPDETPKTVPWRMFALAAGCLLAALLLQPRSDLMIETGLLGRLLGSLREPVGWVACVTLMMLFIGSLASATLGFLIPTQAAARFLPPGGRLGGGPYRSHECVPDAGLVEAIVASIEEAAAGLDGAARQRADALVEAARSDAKAGRFAAAVRSGAGAIAIYRRAIEAARSDGTVGGSGAGPRSPESSRPAWEP